MIWYEGGEHIVMSEFTDKGWTKKDTIVTSDRFFKNWADLPQIYHTGGWRYTCCVMAGNEWGRDV